MTEPPSSNLRAVPNSFFGTSNALMSMPPWVTRPEFVHLLNARAIRVIESSSTTTSRPSSAIRLARSMTSWETRM